MTMPRYCVTHTVLREEYLTKNIEAEDPLAAVRAFESSPADDDDDDYSPGDVVGTPDRAYEVEGPDGKFHYFDDDLKPEVDQS